MKITQSTLKRIIAEELHKMLKEVKWINMQTGETGEMPSDWDPDAGYKKKCADLGGEWEDIRGEPFCVFETPSGKEAVELTALDSYAHGMGFSGGE